MREHHDDLQTFLADCTYTELLDVLCVDEPDYGLLFGVLRMNPDSDVDALINATYRLYDEDLDGDELLLLGSIRELCHAHRAFLDLATDADRLKVDPRRLYAHPDEDLFFIAHYAELLAERTRTDTEAFPGLFVSAREVATTTAVVMLAIVARGYDPLPTSNEQAAALVGLYVMCSALGAGDATDIVAYINEIPQYAARCAAPLFASEYVPGYAGYDEDNAQAILTAVLVAADDGSDDDGSDDDGSDGEQLEDDGDDDR